MGGHCIAVDPWFIVDAAPEEALFIRAARETNLRKTDWVVEQVVRVAKENDRPPVACLGLAYKADVDDLRESPAVEIVHRLSQELGRKILVVEPHISELPKGLVGCSELVDLDTALEQAAIVVPLVAHRAFQGTVPADDRQIIVDPAGVWSS